MSEFQVRDIPTEVVLFKFKELQEYMNRTKTKTHLVAYENDESIRLTTACSGYKGFRHNSYRVNMFDYYVMDLELEHTIMGYLDQEDIVDSLNNSNIIYNYAMCCSTIEKCISFESFLTAVKRYKAGEYDPSWESEVEPDYKNNEQLNKMPSILTEFMAAV